MKEEEQKTSTAANMVMKIKINFIMEKGESNTA